MIYKVKWKDLWRSLTKYMTLTIILSITAILFVHFVVSGFDYHVIFKHLSPIEYLGLYLGIWVFSGFFAFLISVWLKFASITVKDGKISGRNYWGRKKSIPLSEIKSLRNFSNNGINALVVDGGSHGEVFIYLQTENLGKVVTLIESYLPSDLEA